MFIYFKMKIFTLNFFLIIILIIQKIKLKEIIYSINDNQQEFSPNQFLYLNQQALSDLLTFINGKFNKNYTKNQQFSICTNRISKDIADIDIRNLYEFSGLDFFDLGNRDLCIPNQDQNKTYFYALILFEHKLNSNSNKYNEQLKIFRSNNLSNIGVCFWEECLVIFNDVYLNNSNPEFVKYLDLVYNLKIKNITIESKNDQNTLNEQKKKFKISNIIYKIVFFLFLIGIIIKLACECFQFDFFENEEDKNDSSDINELIIEEKEEEDKEDNHKKGDESISNESLFKDNIDISHIKRLENYLENNPLAVNNELSDEKKLKDNSILKMMNEKISFFNDNYIKEITFSSLLGSNNNSLYNSNDLEILCGIRAIILLFITLNYLIRFNYQSPNISDGTILFYKSFYFVFIKLSSFSLHSWIFLDGFIVVFKLNSYTKNKEDFKTYFKFFLKMIPNIFTFILIFILVYFFAEDLGFFYLGNNAFYNQYIQINNNYECLRNPFMFIIPFYIGFTKYNLSQYDNCYEFTYLLVNEFFCITITIFLFYILNKLKSKIVDIIFSLMIILCIILSYLLVIIKSDSIDKYYLLKYILGNNLEIISPLNMFFIFFIGIISGLIYSYYLQSMRDLELFYRKNLYLPFKFCIKIMKMFIKNDYLKIIFNIISIIIICILCLIYTLITRYKLGNNSLLIDFTFSLKIIYVYETPIFVLFFSIIVLNLMFSDDKFQVRLFLSSKIFNIFERISFTYICLIQYIILYISTILQLQVQFWDYLYIWHIATFQFIITVIISSIITLFLTIPSKVILNKFLKKSSKKTII